MTDLTGSALEMTGVVTQVNNGSVGSSGNHVCK